MKKLFTLIVIALLVSVGANAQEKKTWDFTKGISSATLADLAADAAWTKTYNDDGSLKNAVLSTKGYSGEIMANGKVVKELAGLVLGGISAGNGNNLDWYPAKLRLNRKDETLTFPSLKNGQTLTIVGRSANTTATDRGIKATSTNLVPIGDNTESDIMLGSGVDGSKGTYTFKWRVETTGDDLVEVKVQTMGGPLDCTLFMIDDGDPIITSKIAYLYAGDTSADKVLEALEKRENTEIVKIDVANTTITAEQLQEYEVTVIGASVPVDNAAVATLKEAMPFNPVLNLNANLYAAWGYGEATVSSRAGFTSKNKHSLFAGIDLTDADERWVVLLSKGDYSTVILGDYFAGDDIVATDEDEEDLVAIHVHNANHNAYVYIPVESIEETPQLFANALDLLIESKQEITPATTPVISQEFKDKNTNVTITAGPGIAQPKTRLFYTTDGTDPTAESTEYTGVINFTEPTTVKAVAIAEGYTLSAVSSLDILIKEQPSTPVIAVEQNEGETVVTLSCQSENVDIWYNFEEETTTDTLKSTKYTDPIVVTSPQTVTAFAVAGGAVWSEIATQRVVVKNARVVIDVAAHFQAKQWTADNNPEGKSVANGKGMFSWGASAVTMYTGTGTAGVDPDTGDDIIVYGPEDLRPLEAVNEPGENPEWVLKSRGTCLIWQNNDPKNTNFGENEGGYYPIHATDVDPLFPVTSYDIQFYKFQANETPNASIETLNQYQAPLDIVVLANMQGGPLLGQVSADGENWTTVGEIAATGYSRMWNKSTVSYNGTDKVYVRVTQDVISVGAKVFDIYIANQGEKSNELKAQYDAEYNEVTTGIQNANKQSQKLTQAIYSLNGVRQQSLKRGLNIVVLGDGSVRKVVVK